MEDPLQIAAKFKELSLRLVHKSKASHIGSALSIALGINVAGRVARKETLLKPLLQDLESLLLSEGCLN